MHVEVEKNFASNNGMVESLLTEWETYTDAIYLPFVFQNVTM
jgi:hypothetical protein